MDPFGATASATIALSSISTPPIPHILYPATGASFYSSQAINLRGFADDLDDKPITDAELSWTSSISGAIGTGRSLWVTLPLGVHTITLTATNATGQAAQTSMLLTITLGADYPTAKILSPSDMQGFGDVGTSISFQGVGTDPVDGALTGVALEWYSSIDGFLGTGNNISAVLSGNPYVPICHNVTLKVTNSAGRQAMHSITVCVGRIQ